MRQYLREIRKQSGLSQQDVAEKIQVTRQYYQQIEKGVRQKEMSLPLLIRLSQIFEIPVFDLIEKEVKNFEQCRSKDRDF
mgnify:CR=1 FL=1